MKNKDVQKDLYQKDGGGGINCSIFLEQEPTIRGLTDKINQSRVAKGKLRYAEELLTELKVILYCLEYQSDNLCCRNCHLITNLRQKAADLIIRSSELPQESK